MNFQANMLNIYPRILRRIRGWGLLLLLFLLYLSAYCMRNYEIMEEASHIGLSSIHVFCGFLLIIVSIILTYDFVIARQSVFNANEHHGLSRFLPGAGQSGDSALIERLFYFFIFLTCFFGLLLHYIKVTAFRSFIINEISIQIIHETIGWFFLSIIFIRYYRLSVRWFGKIKKYLREV